LPPWTAVCHTGLWNTALKPPPVAPSPGSFHTTSPVIAEFATVMLVPPQPTTWGLEAGKSAWLPGCCACPGGKSLAPLSPAAQ
jgi:hypothetical protein